MRKNLKTTTLAALLGAGALTASTLGLAATASATTASADTASADTAASSRGCAVTGKHVPKGAVRAGAGDIDGDGRNDQVWVSADRKGFVTAGGAVFSQKIANAGGPEVGVFALHLDNDVVALVEQGRTTYVSALADCTLKKTVTRNGEQVQYNRGFSSPYRDLGCLADDDYSELNALRLGHDEAAKKPWSVKQTVLNVSTDGARATNGDSTLKRYATRAAAMKALGNLSSARTCSTPVASLV
ncbi:hypothetical protein [Kineosporia succinea]|uniref:VCBS repeat protein n=1 Tax=Kineosporia succinea TaxID=84632 RepID=A0ABT9P0E4_9ACTN|nr:hypothetical protein [Kineosporia succinea]MDP9826144.1 hypothetical protein [Kineosporia succinea]